MELIYTRIDAGIRIDQVKEPEEVVIIPEELDGLQVVEIGAYALAGTQVEELHLPSGIVKIGAYACYNCERLKRMFCFSRIRDLGTGMFAGAKGAEFLDITQITGETSYFKDMLSELRQTLRVRIHGTEEARLIFPEYFEEWVENTPARILFTETHGCGHRYRYSFRGREFQYLDYDELFLHVQVQEAEELVVEMAMGRIRYPYQLSPFHETMYHQYIKEHWRMAGALLVEANCRRRARFKSIEPGLMPWFVEHYIDTASQVETLIQLAQDEGDTEAVSWLMDARHKRFEATIEESVTGTGAEEKLRKRRFQL